MIIRIAYLENSMHYNWRLPNFTLNISVTSICIFLVCILTALALSNNSLKVAFLSLRTTRSDLSCILFILLSKVLEWFIHVTGQWLNRKLIKAFITSRFLSVLLNNDTRHNAFSFQLAFAHKLLIRWSEVSLLSIRIPSNLCSNFSTHFLFSIYK